MPETATSSHIAFLTPKSELELYVSSGCCETVLQQHGALKTQAKVTVNFQKGVWEDDNNKMAMLVCLIIIAVLFLRHHSMSINCGSGKQSFISQDDQNK